MKRLLLALLLLLPLSAHAQQSVAFLPHGAGGCPSYNGATILPLSTCALTDNAGFVWTYNGGTNLLRNGVSQSPNKAFGLGNCGGTCTSLSPFLAYQDNNYPGAPLLWFLRGDGQSLSPITVPAPSNLWVNTTTSATYGSIGTLSRGANPGDQLSAPANPNGIPMMYSDMIITDDGVTLTCDSGESSGGYTVPSGVGAGVAPFVIAANNVTTDGCNTGYVKGGNIFGAKVLEGNTGWTAKNMTVAYSDTNWSTGGYNGVTTWQNIITYGGGNPGAEGQTHNIYAGKSVQKGYDSSSLVIEPVPSGTVGLESYDVVSGGHLLKVRKTFFTGSYMRLYCTSSSQFVCNPDRPIDLPCGGQHVITNSVAERGPAETGDDFVYFGSELTNGTNSCGAIYGTTTSSSSDMTGVTSFGCSVYFNDPYQCGFNSGAPQDLAAINLSLQDGTTILSWDGPLAPAYQDFNLSGQTTGTVSGSGSTVTTINTALVTTLALATTPTTGTIKFTSGANNGASRTIGAYTPGTSIQVTSSFQNAPAAGDTFTVSAACADPTTCIKQGDTFQVTIDANVFNTAPLAPATPTLTDVVAAINAALTGTFHVAVTGATSVEVQNTAQYLSNTITGNTHAGSTTIDGLSTNVNTAGWRGWYSLTGGSVPSTSIINGLAANGLSVTITQPAVSSANGVTFTVTGGTVFATASITSPIGAEVFTAATDAGNFIFPKAGKFTLHLSKPAISTPAFERISAEEPNQSLLLDKMIFIDDRGKFGNPGVPECLVWSRTYQSNASITVQNSILVNNPSYFTNQGFGILGAMHFGCNLGQPGVNNVTIGSGNLCYANRTDAFGAGHDFPYEPPVLTSAPVPNGNEISCPTT
jgi:hypothetical protein